MTEATSLAALKPCPFCGHPPVLRPIKNDGRWIADCNTVTCIRPTTGLRRNKSEAIAAWDPRATDQRCAELEAENARLMEEVSNLKNRRYTNAVDELERARAALGENRDG